MASTDLVCEEFLDLVWVTDGWVDLPAKVGKFWVPFHAEWPFDEAACTRRIDSSIRDRENLYFSVTQFSRRGRRIEDVLPPIWLWADLDEVHPSEATAMGLMPTVAIESSPGRYQALWRLTRRAAPKAVERVNRALTYALDADKGGWDLTQVLRLPGTRNWKYPGGPTVRLLWVEEGLEYNLRDVWDHLREHIPQDELESVGKIDIPRTGIPPRAKRLLRVGVDQVVEGERSHRLWELECMLAESGLAADEIFMLVWPCAWNKWQGINTGRDRLAREIRKAIQHVRRRRNLKDTGVSRKEKASRTEAPTTETTTDESDSTEESEQVGTLPWVTYSSFMAMRMDSPRWLIEDVWVAGSHGIIGGEPKTQKTTWALAMGLAVASGSPMMGRWSVGRQGPVLMVQEENDPWMVQDRLRKMAAYTGLISTRDARVRAAPKGSLGEHSIELDFPVDLPLKLLNNYGFDLGLEEHRDMLEAEVEAVRPVLVILDPLYLLLGTANENQAWELRPFLKWLLALRYRYDCSVVLIHHMKKQQQGMDGGVRLGQRLMGNAILHGWADSAIYTERLEDEREGWTKARMETEFRSMAPRRPTEVAVHFGEPGNLMMDLEIERYSIERVLVNMVTREPGITVIELARRLNHDKRTILARCRGSESLEVESGKRGRGHTHKVWLNGTNGQGSV